MHLSADVTVSFKVKGSNQGNGEKENRKSSQVSLASLVNPKIVYIGFFLFLSQKPFLSEEQRVDYVQVDEQKTQALQNTKQEWTDERQSKV